MRRTIIIGFLFLTVGACRGLWLSARAPAAATDESAPIFYLVVHHDDGYVHADLSLAAPDAGTVWSQRVPFPTDERGTVVLPTGWYQGRGPYAFRMEFLRSDGGTGSQIAQLPLQGNESRVDGFATFFGFDPRPGLHMELVETAPPGLRLEAASAVSAQGVANYDVVNATQRTFYGGTPYVTFERREKETWAPIEPRFWPACIDPSQQAALHPGEHASLDLVRTMCLVETLRPGHYRHAYRLALDSPESALLAWSADAAEISRTVQLESEFDVSGDSPGVSAQVLGAVPVADLRVEPAWVTWRVRRRILRRSRCA